MNVKVLPQLLPRAALMRLRSLDLGGTNDYYTTSAAESSSTLVASAPESTNMYVIAYGDKEGLAPGERLEMYGSTVRLIRTLAYGCPRGRTAESVLHGALSDKDLGDITRQLDRVATMYNELDLHGARHAGGKAHTNVEGKREASKASGDGIKASASEESLWDIVRKAGAPVASADPSAQSSPADPPPTLSPSELEKREQQMRLSNREVVAAEWRRRERIPTLITPMNGETEDDLLVENGVCFSSPEQAGLRVLRAARLAFMSMIERKANTLREAQMRKHGVSEEPRALSVLDVSGLDFTFSHAAVQSTVELGLHDETQCRINFIPLNDSAARCVEGALGTFVRQVVRAPGIAHADPFALLSLRSVDVAAYTVYLDLSPPTNSGSKSQRQEDTSQQQQRADAAEGQPGDAFHIGNRRAASVSARTRRSTEKASVQLARALALLRSGSSMLVTVVPTPRSAAAIYAEVCHGRRAEVAMETSAVAEAKACVAAAISRCGRWGYITDEVLPLVDCPQGSAVSLVVMVL